MEANEGAKRFHRRKSNLTRQPVPHLHLRLRRQGLIRLSHNMIHPLFCTFRARTVE